MNTTITNQLNRRSIRSFKKQPISPEIIDTLIDVARHSASSSFQQAVSLMSITDQDLKDKIAVICNQNYVATSGHLFILVMDQFRNHSIASENNQDTEVLQSADRFLSSAMDAGLMAQSIEVAANSLGLGAVFLGSIQNDSQAIIELLNLPEYTFPILGLAIGYPDQTPQIKPKLPKELMHFENSYTVFNNYNEIFKDYDAIVGTYYDLRNSNTRVDTFTNQMTSRMNARVPKRLDNLNVLNRQKLIKF